MSHGGTNMVKWLVIGFLGTAALGLVFFFAIFSRFSPW